MEIAPKRIITVGGGAAGFFAAIACAEAQPQNEVIILERTANFLSKVRISGGGRCNVTHAPDETRAFTKNYPRGERALIGALHRFAAEETIAWFERRGVRVKTEEDGRVFPVTDSSGTVIDCLLFEAKTAGVKLLTRRGVEEAQRKPSGGFLLTLSDRTSWECDRLLLATGGARDPIGAQMAHSLGHTIAPAVPSLFSLHISTPWLLTLPGVAAEDVEISVAEMKLRERGPLLITHNGVSGPSVLRLSAWGARALAECDYRFPLTINWLPAFTSAALEEELRARRSTQPKRHVMNSPLGHLPARLWEQLASQAKISRETIWTTLTREQSQALVRQIARSEFLVEGKSLNKDEFVTCGGVDLREIDFKTMQSRLVPDLYFAGELLDLDGITGGFNFQAAWTTGWIAGHAIADAQKS